MPAERQWTEILWKLVENYILEASAASVYLPEDGGSRCCGNFGNSTKLHGVTFQNTAILIRSSEIIILYRWQYYRLPGITIRISLSYAAEFSGLLRLDTGGLVSVYWVLSTFESVVLLSLSESRSVLFLDWLPTTEKTIRYVENSMTLPVDMASRSADLKSSN